jgi:hypothetical protein
MNKTVQNRTDCAGLTTRQFTAITALLANTTVEGAARSARVSRTQLYAWLAEPGFKAELVRRRAEVFTSALDRLKTLSGQAVDALADLLNARGDPRTRLGAVRVALDSAFTAQENQEFEERLSALERLAESKER